MKTRHGRILCIATGLLLTISGLPAVAMLASTARSSLAASKKADPKLKAADAAAKQPLRFEPNVGQFDPQVKFQAQGPGYTMFLTPTEVVFSLSIPDPAPAKLDANGQTPVDHTVNHTARIVRTKLTGSNPAPKIVGGKRQAAVTNYMIGNDPSHWHTNVAGYSEVRYRDVYPGIDQVFYGADGGSLEYDFVVSPGADPAVINQSFEGAQPSIGAGGDLVLQAGPVQLRQGKPTMFEQHGKRHQPVNGSFNLRPDGLVGLAVGPHDRTKTLVIDPLVKYASYLAGTSTGSGVGSDSYVTDVAADPATAGTLYLTGTTFTTNFPTTTGQTVFQGASGGQADRFISKMTTLSSGTASLAWTTYLGGSRFEDDFNNSRGGSGIAVDSDLATGSTAGIYVTGLTTSSDFPVTTRTITNKALTSNVATLTTSAAHGFTVGQQIAVAGVDATFNGAYKLTAVTSTTFSYVKTAADVTSVTATGTARTSCGISASSDCDANTNTYDDGNVTNTNWLNSATMDLGTDDLGSVVNGCGWTNTPITWVGSSTSAIMSTNPTSPTNPCSFTISHRDPVADAFLTKLDKNGQTLMYSSYLGGGAADKGRSVALAPGSTNRIAAVVGSTTSTDMPTVGAYDASCGTATLCNAVNSATYTDGAVPSTNLARFTSGNAGFTAADVGRAINIGGTAKTISSVYNESTVVVSPAATVAASNLSFYILARDRKSDGFVAEVDTDAPDSTLVYSTYYGGASVDDLRGVAVDTSGSIYTEGTTSSTGLPSAGSYQSSINLGSANGNGVGCDAGTGVCINDLMVAKLNPAGGGTGLQYSTYLGGTATDVGSGASGGIALSGTTAFVTGTTYSSDFPTKSPTTAYQTAMKGDGDAFVAKIDTAASGAASLVYSTFLGGRTKGADTGNDIAVDTGSTGCSTGCATIVGSTVSTDFPTYHQFQDYALGSDGFLTQLDVNGAALNYSTFLGGSGDDYADAVAIEPSTSYPLVVGQTKSSDLPTTASARQTARQGSGLNGFVVRVDPSTTPPLISSLSPRGGPTTGGTTVTLTGTGFTGASQVTVGTTSVTPTSVADTSITLTMPTGTAGAVNVTVTTPIGTSHAKPFVYGEGIFQAQPTANPVGSCGTDKACKGPMVTLADGKVLAAYGTSSGSAKIFDPVAGSWSATPTFCTTCAELVGQPNQSSTLTLLNDGRVLLAGGQNNAASPLSAATANLYDPATGIWTPLSPAMGQARAFHSATVLTNGDVLVAGGCVNLCFANGEPGLKSAEIFHPTTGGGTWTMLATNKWMTTGRFGHTATLINGFACRVASPAPVQSCGKVLLAGGGNIVGGTPGLEDAPIKSTELYNGTGFEAGGDMTTPRRSASAVLIDGATCANATGTSQNGRCGKILIAGGNDGTSDLASAELYDVTLSITGQNTRVVAAGNMSSARSYFAMVPLLPSSRILAVGGTQNRPGVDTGDVYDPIPPTVGAWGGAAGLTAAASFGPRSAAVITAGPASACGTRCGQVLVNEVASGTGNTNTDLYTPQPAIFSIAPTGDCTNGGSGVSITGTGLTSASAAGGSVTFGGTTPVASPRLVSSQTNPDTKLVAVSPGTAGTGNVQVSTPGGKSPFVSAGVFTYGTQAVPCTPIGSGSGNAPSVTAIGSGSATVNWTAPPGATQTGYKVATSAPVFSYSDGATVVGATFFSPSAAFRPSDVGACIVGGTIPAGTCISAVLNDYSVTLSASATAAAKGVAFTIDSRSNTTRTDGVSIAGATYTSAGAVFTAADQGKRISGTNIPAGATVATVTNATTIQLDAGHVPTVAGSGLSFTITNRAYGAPATIVVASGAATSQVVTGLSPSTTNSTGLGYTFTVTGTNANGEGAGAVTAVTSA